MLVHEVAEKEKRPVEVLVDEWTEWFRGQTINSIREELKAQQKTKQNTEPRSACQRGPQ